MSALIGRTGREQRQKGRRAFSSKPWQCYSVAMTAEVYPLREIAVGCRLLSPSRWLSPLVL